MPYDLYGTYYESERDARNAEEAQCARIDADIAMRDVRNTQMHTDQLYQLVESQHYEIMELRDKMQAALLGSAIAYRS